MKKADVKLNATYQVKVSGKLAPVKLTREHPSGGWEGVNLATGKAIRVKTAQRLRGLYKSRIMTKAEYEAGPDVQPATDTTAAPERDTSERDATPAKPMSLLDAAAHLLSLGAGDPMRCKDIVDLATERGLWTPGAGRTPANTLYSAILREIKVKGDASRFVKTERGKFALAAKR